MIGDHVSTCRPCLHAQVAVKEARPRTQAAMDPLLAVPRVPHVSLAGNLPEASGPGTQSSEPLLVQPEEVFLPSSRGEEGGVGSSPNRAVDVVRSCPPPPPCASLLPVPQPVVVPVQLQLQLLLLVVALERVCMVCSCCLRRLACVDVSTFALAGDPPNGGLRSASCGGGLQSQDAHTSHPAHGCCESYGSSEGGRPQRETTSTWCAYVLLLASCASLLSITLCDFSLSFPRMLWRSSTCSRRSLPF